MYKMLENKVYIYINDSDTSKAHCIINTAYLKLNKVAAGGFDLSSPGQNGPHFAKDIFRRIFVNEKFCIFVKISLQFVPKGPINNNPALV